MRKKEQQPITNGEPPPAPPEKKQSRLSGCYAPLFFVVIIVVALVILSSSRGSSSPSPPPQLTPTPTTPSNPTAPSALGLAAPTAVPARSLSSSSFNCQPGIAVGGMAKVMHKSVRMRRSPGYIEKNDSIDSIHYMTTGDVVSVRGGPQQQDGLCWWLIEHAGYQGWTADHSQEGILLLAGP